ncbi:hypothetical protein CERSUDRAFT_75054 [Gelatoporia subvermispora B]|uniref:Peptidase C14 caspase domain-containing protein n=1 Tax=Ceriporiopsis subvermispora (strain B) TaxID=914234 RepID=M2PHF2_CERS8|nr:hypothetical protein CERSUDRAFT_75054 [Gelatoporia subvermispora B]
MSATVRPPVRKALSVAVRYRHLNTLDPYLELPDTHYDPPIVRNLLTGNSSLQCHDVMGCVPDWDCWVEVYGFREEDITTLMDDDDHVWPTRDNILKAMHELVADTRPGDELVFHFSGHGWQVVNLDGSEEDGYDEVLWPADIEYDGNDEHQKKYILDDEIREILVNHLPRGSHFLILLDCCHSGTAVDLPNSNGEFCPRTPASPLRPDILDGVRGAQAFATLHSAQHEDDDFVHSPVKTRRFSGFESLLEADTLPLVKPLIAVQEAWSACMDSQVTLEKRGGGGLFVSASQ